MYNSFRSERLQGDKSVWDPMIKRKLPTFSETAKLFKMQFDDKVVQLYLVPENQKPLIEKLSY